ncbi:hypothetical protein DVV91_09945 [Clostridium botulinum]|uniref:hypothetical protein n=1 Tax=Clostridium botulinum TaxID=1491 RepID=UPI001967AB52|nr:hypothetical protein [Clostridium botulinum]MBN1074662.1 hypothetical protein [Clostridium botulinum]
MLNKTMCLLSLSLLLTTSTVNTKPMFVAEQSIEKINLKEMVQTDLNNELLMNKLRVQNGEKTSIQLYIEKQERIRLEAEKQKKLEERLKTKKEDKYNINFILTFYGNSSEENGGYTGKTCLNKKLQTGMCASNVYQLGTKIEMENGRILTVSDVGGSDFCSPNRLDVYVDTYDNNVLNKLGRQKIKGRIIK